MPVPSAPAGMRWGPAVASTSPHAYFEGLIARPDHYKSESLREQVKFTKQYNNGGLLASNCPQPYYVPASDSDPHAQDACKLFIPPFQIPGGCHTGYLTTQPIAASSSGAHESIFLQTVTSTFGPPGQRQIQIDSEIMQLRVLSTAEGGDGIRAWVAATGKLGVIRGQSGTVALAHDAGTQTYISGNALNPYLHIPLMTEDGHSYLITWDEYWTDSYLGIGRWNPAQKTYQIKNGNNSKLFEPRLRFDGGTAGVSRPAHWNPALHVAAIDVRAYNSTNTGQSVWAESNGNTLGPGWTLGGGGTYLQPQAGTFAVTANRWTRFWVLVEQRANDWDRFSFWVADTHTDPVLIIDKALLSVSGGGTAQSCQFFDFEHADSQPAFLRGGVFDLVSYVRGWAVSKDPANLAELLTRPMGAS